MVARCLMLSFALWSASLQADCLEDLWSVEHVHNRLPVEMAATFPQQKILVLGVGDLYAGFLSVETAMNHLTGGTDHRYLYDPQRKPNAGTWVNTLDEIPDGAAAFILTPNRFHLEQLRELSQKKNLKGIYVEKPVVISKAELAQLDEVVRNSKVPIYFGDHYLGVALPLLVAQGQPNAYSSQVRVVRDPTGKLAQAIQSGKPVLGKITKVSAKVLELGQGLEKRTGYFSKKAGGGVLLDLQIHLSNLAGKMGLDISRVTKKELTPFHAATEPSDAAEERARFSGVLPNGGTFDFEVGQFAAARQNYFELTDDTGHKLILDLNMRTVSYRGPHGEDLGMLAGPIDPYVQTVHQALRFFESATGNQTYNYELQRAATAAIEDLKDTP